MKNNSGPFKNYLILNFLSLLLSTTGNAANCTQAQNEEMGKQAFKTMKGSLLIIKNDPLISPDITYGVLQQDIGNGKTASTLYKMTTAKSGDFDCRMVLSPRYDSNPDMLNRLIESAKTRDLVASQVDKVREQREGKEKEEKVNLFSSATCSKSKRLGAATSFQSDFIKTNNLRGQVDYGFQEDPSTNSVYSLVKSGGGEKKVLLKTEFIPPCLPLKTTLIEDPKFIDSLLPDHEKSTAKKDFECETVSDEYVICGNVKYVAADTSESNCNPLNINDQKREEANKAQIYFGSGTPAGSGRAIGR